MPEALALEARAMLSLVVPIPKTNKVMPLSKIFWNGEADSLSGTGIMNVPSPEAAGAMKTLTITNNSNDRIYPFLRSPNVGRDPNSKPPFDNALYDPQDPYNQEYRLYVGYRTRNGAQYLGLPRGATITFQLPLVLWDGDNLSLAVDGKGLTSANTPYAYNPEAAIAVAGAAPVSGSHWIESSSKYPAGTTPIVMFYHSPTALAPSNEALSQLAETAIRDPYLTHFINDPKQTFPLLNYDVSFVNNMVAPVSMEATQVPIVDGPPTSPTFYGQQAYGWTGSSGVQATFGERIKDFVKNQGIASVGQYFGGKGWPEYYNPDTTPAAYDIPSGANLFANSPLNVTSTTPTHVSGFDDNHWNLTSAGDSPIQAGGRGVGDQGKVLPDQTSRIDLMNLPQGFGADILQMLKAGPVEVSFPGPNAAPLSQVASYVPNLGGMPYVTLKSPIAPTSPSGSVFQFTRPASDYAITAITNLWYSWAEYNVQQHQNFPDQALAGTTTTASNAAGKVFTSNVIQLSQAPNPAFPIFAGMTVTAPDLPSGTTVVKVNGNSIQLSRIPTDVAPANQTFTFGKPVPLPYDPAYTTPYTLSFDPADTPKAQLFAASVYEAMAATAPASTPSPYLPQSMNLVSQVIGFNLVYPDYSLDGGPNLVGNIRDVVKSILRGVYSFNDVPDQSQWYPDPSQVPSGLTSGQNFNVYNLDPYVWFVHKVQGLNAYGFSLDDDISNPSATGPPVDQNLATNHAPNNIQIQFSGTDHLSNPKEWFPVLPWGTLTADATIDTLTRVGPYQGYPVITIHDPTPTPTNPTPDTKYQTYLKVNNPGDGAIGATVLAPDNPGVIPAGTTLKYKVGLFPGQNPQIVMVGPNGSKPAVTPTSTPIPITITAQSTSTP